MHQEQNKKTDQLNSENGDTNGKPPFLGSWKNIYLVILLSLTVTIIFLYFFSEAFQ